MFSYFRVVPLPHRSNRLAFSDDTHLGVGLPFAESFSEDLKTVIQKCHKALSERSKVYCEMIFSD